MLRLMQCVFFVLILFGFSAVSSADSSDSVSKPIIFSTDSATGLSGGLRPGASDIDDGLAIAMALDLPQLDVLGVIVTFGNNLMEPSFSVAQTVVRGMNSDIPVVRGASRPLPPLPVRGYQGDPIHSACRNEGVEAMAELVAASDQPVTILAIGPLTDPGCLLLNHPELASSIEAIVVIGGRGPDQIIEINDQPLPDFNLALDFEAVRFLLNETPVRLRFLPFSLTSSVLIPSGQSAVLCDSNLGLAANYFCPAVANRNQFWNETFGEDGFHPWDQNAVYLTVVPDAYQCEPASYKMIDCGTTACAGHDPNEPARLSIEAGQLFLTPDGENSRIEICSAYSSSEAKEGFEKAIFDFAR